MARSAGCCGTLPYIAIVSAIVAGAGVGTWWVYINRAYTDSERALDAVGIVYPPIAKYQASTVGYLVIVCIDVAVLLGVAIWRSSLLCKRNNHTSSPGSHTFFSWMAGVASFLNFLVVTWVMLNVVAIAAAATVLLTVSFASTTAATELTKVKGTTANLLNDVNNFIGGFDNATAANPVAATVLAPLKPTVDKLRPLAAGTTNGTSAGCPPLCVDLAAFKYTNYTTRCICDPKVLETAGQAAFDAAVNASAAGIGGFTLFIGLLWLLMNVCGQVAGACTDSWHLHARRDDHAHPTYKPDQFAAA